MLRKETPTVKHKGPAGGAIACRAALEAKHVSLSVRLFLLDNYAQPNHVS